MKNILKAAFLLFAVSVFSAEASVSNGTIDTSFFKTKVCHDVTCTTPAPGIFNMKPTGTTAVTIEDSAGVDGIGWGSEIGWIVFDPTGPEGVTINATTGELSGKAWAQASSWINFRPANSGTTALGVPIGVRITNNGEFYGWAWTGGPNGGWILFDCSNAATCVKTDWRPLGARTTTTPVTAPPSSNGSPSGGLDLCANMLGTQLTIPSGYVFDQGICTAVPQDACGNLPGFQAGVPLGYRLDGAGMCVLPQDFCSNLDGVQEQVPNGMVVRADGTCGARQPFEIDVDDDGIIDIPGTGTSSTGTIVGLPTVFNPETPPASVPAFLKPYTERLADRCPNLDGFQASIPLGFVADTVGWCVPTYIDYCPNIDGEQPVVPSDLYIDESGACVLSDSYPFTYPTEVGKTIVSFEIVPPDVRIPVYIPFVAEVMESIDGMRPASVNMPSSPRTDAPLYPVDLVSVMLLADMVLIISLSVYLLMKSVFRFI
jgi:hypothetical protein